MLRAQLHHSVGNGPSGLHLAYWWAALICMATWTRMEKGPPWSLLACLGLPSIESMPSRMGICHHLLLATAVVFSRAVA